MTTYQTNKITFAVLFLVLSTHALNLENAKEQTCVPIKKTAAVDNEWMMSVKVWYYPLMSRLDLYLTSLELSGNTEDPTKLRESQVYYDNCVKTEFVGNLAIATGFNGKTKLFTTGLPTVNDDGVTYERFTTESGLGMSIYTTLTDNKSYIFMAVCWDDNQASWLVMSTVEKLPEETVKSTHEHAEELGFKKEYFEELRYDNCVDGEKNAKSVKKSETCEKGKNEM